MKKIFLILLAMTATIFTVSAQYKAPKIIAHRGYHATEGAARNSLNALKAAQQKGYFGSECDINRSADGELLVIHGYWHPNKESGVHVQRNTKAEIQAIKLTSGEVVPTLDEYLAQAKKSKKTKLIIEIKNHATPAIETEVVREIVAKVASYGLEKRVEYIAFRPWVCTELVKYAPKGTQIAYLNSDYEPEYVKGMGCTGIDYRYRNLVKKPHWIKKAQELGMTVNVWTVNKEEDIRWCIEHGVDYITTDNPVLVEQLIKEMCK
mgnify:CR=1 FL=1